jgi:hypothetical protein
MGCNKYWSFRHPAGGDRPNIAATKWACLWPWQRCFFLGSRILDSNLQGIKGQFHRMRPEQVLEDNANGYPVSELHRRDSSLVSSFRYPLNLLLIKVDHFEGEMMSVDPASRTPSSHWANRESFTSLHFGFSPASTLYSHTIRGLGASIFGWPRGWGA